MTPGPFAAVVICASALIGAAASFQEDAVRPTGALCARPYTASSPWNARIPANPAYHPRSAEHVAALGSRLSSDPTQYTYPVYLVGANTPRRAVKLSGQYSNVTHAGTRLVRHRRVTVQLPIPDGARPAAGEDSQAIFVDPATGDEWGVFELSSTDEGWTGKNAYHYNTRWSGVPPLDRHKAPFGSRGAGVPYLAGLVRPCEIARGRIDHALAFAYDYPTSEFVYPATKSDGDSNDAVDLPEGSRLQLDPALTPAALRSRGCRAACLTIARALQEYGMYVIDNSGRPKVMIEYEQTARWNGRISAKTVAPIPLDAFRVLLPRRPNS